jgi:hypothetical protein
VCVWGGGGGGGLEAIGHCTSMADNLKVDWAELSGDLLFVSITGV